MTLPLFLHDRHRAPRGREDWTHLAPVHTWLAVHLLRVVHHVTLAVGGPQGVLARLADDLEMRSPLAARMPGEKDALAHRHPRLRKLAPLKSDA